MTLKHLGITVLGTLALVFINYISKRLKKNLEGDDPAIIGAEDEALRRLKEKKKELAIPETVIPEKTDGV